MVSMLFNIVGVLITIVAYIVSSCSIISVSLSIPYSYRNFLALRELNLKHFSTTLTGISQDFVFFLLRLLFASGQNWCLGWSFYFFLQHYSLVSYNQFYYIHHWILNYHIFLNTVAISVLKFFSLPFLCILVCRQCGNCCSLFMPLMSCIYSGNI